MKEKRRVIIITILFLLIGIFVVFRITRERNVFDEMYYTRVHRFIQPDRIFVTQNAKNPRGMFANMPQLGRFSWNYEREKNYVKERTFREYYESEYLKENERLEIRCYTENKEMYIDFSCEDEDGYKWYSYHYYIKEKLLVYETNDPEDLKGRKDFLYEIFLPDWFEANEGISDYSMDDLGEFEFVDEKETSEAE